ISFDELAGIEGSGAEGRLTKDDLLVYIQHKQNQGGQSATPAAAQKAPAAAAEQPVLPTPAKPVVSQSSSVSGGDEIIEMDRMRKLIAEHMVMSKHTAPHVTSFVEADVTNMVKWRDRVKKPFEKRENE